MECPLNRQEAGRSLPVDWDSGGSHFGIHFCYLIVPCWSWNWQMPFPDPPSRLQKSSESPVWPCVLARPCGQQDANPAHQHAWSNHSWALQSARSWATPVHQHTQRLQDSTTTRGLMWSTQGTCLEHACSGGERGWCFQTPKGLSYIRQFLLDWKM